MCTDIVKRRGIELLRLVRCTFRDGVDESVLSRIVTRSVLVGTIERCITLDIRVWDYPRISGNCISSFWRDEDALVV